MAVRLLHQAFIQRELRKRGCTYVKEYGTADGSSRWLRRP